MIKNKLRRHLEETIPEADLRLWFDPLELSLDPDDAAVTVVFPHAFFAQWFETRIKDRFERQVGLFLGKGSALRYRSKVDEAGADPSALPAQPVNVDFPFGHEFTFEQFFTNHKNLFPPGHRQGDRQKPRAQVQPLHHPGAARHGEIPPDALHGQRDEQAHGQERHLRGRRG